MIGGRRRKPGFAPARLALPYEMEHRLFAIGKGYAWHLSRASPLLDAHGAVVRWYGTTTDIDDQKQREENIRDLMAEVNHRSRNLLAVAQAIARCGVANAKTIHEFQERYSERLLGLAASQDLLTDRNWRGVPLEALVRAQARSFLSGEALCERRAAGPAEPQCDPNARPCLARTVRQRPQARRASRTTMATSLSFGGSTRAGPSLSFEMTWRERGGPPVNRDGGSPGSATSCSNVSPPQVSTPHRH